MRWALRSWLAISALAAVACSEAGSEAPPGSTASGGVAGVIEGHLGGSAGSGWVSGGAAGAGGGSGSAGTAGSAGTSGGGGAAGNGGAAGAGAGGSTGTGGAGLGGSAATGGGAGLGGGAATGGSGGSAPKDACAGQKDGAYCGGTIGAGAGNLVTCGGGVTKSSKDCANGCLKPTIGPDVCKSACCLKKPPGSFVRGYNACPASSSAPDHYGIDYSSAKGTEIPAGMDATVVKVVTGYPNCWGSGSGAIKCSNSCMANYNVVRLKSLCGDPKNPNRDFYVEYAHVSGVAKGVKQGAVVKKGEIIAYVGASGCASGPHIHFETISVPKGAPAPVRTCASVDPTTRYCN
jgi:hypothetical protein